MAKKKGLFSRLIEGPERSEEYASSTLPSNRWQLGWDVLKTNFSKLFLLNLLIILFLIPLIALFVFRYISIKYDASVYPFIQNMGLGFPGYPSVVGLSSSIIITENLKFFALLIVAVAVASVGISGSFYVMRNMVWAEGVFVGSDFWKGVKKDYGVVFLSLLFYSVILFFSVMSISMSSYLIDVHASVKALLYIAQAMSWIIIIFMTVTVMYMITIGVTYTIKFKGLLRNSAIFALALLPTNVFFLLFGCICFLPLLLMNVTLVFVFGIMTVIIIGFSVFVLVWTNYSQWVFDKYLNDKIPGAKKNRGIYKRAASSDNGESDISIIEKSKLTSTPIKPITDYDVELYELPESFSRKDLEKLEETKAAMRRDSDLYVEEHKDDYKNKENANSFESLLNNEEGKSDNDSDETTGNSDSGDEDTTAEPNGGDVKISENNKEENKNGDGEENK